MVKPINKDITIRNIPIQGRFGVDRRYDIHTGVDLYCDNNEPVYAIEDGVIVNICYFTGPTIGSHWWNETKAILIEGVSGVILYGELETNLSIGDSIKEGQHIGNVLQVLKTDKGLPMSMLHIELYKTGYKEDGEWWQRSHNQPKNLLNIEGILTQIYK